jgi:phosphonatase-like hydrolase
MIKIVVFDMAGTSINEDNVVYKCINNSLSIHGYNFTLEEVLDICAGKEKKIAIHDILKPILENEKLDHEVLDVHKTFESLLDNAYSEQTMSLFDGMIDVFSFLKGNDIKSVFNTGYHSNVAKRILEKVRVNEGKEIDLLVTADMVENSRPAPDMINYALRKFNFNSNECLKIGDSAIDIEEGKNAGAILNIGITTGAQNREQLMKASPDFIIDHMTDLIPLIIKHNESA